MSSLILEPGETLIVKNGAKIILEDGGQVLVKTVSWSPGEEKGAIVLEGGPGIYCPKDGGGIWGAVNNVNSHYPDWRLGSASPAKQRCHCLRIDVDSDHSGSSAIEIEKHGKGGYGIAMRVYSDNPENPMLPKGIGIDIWRRATGLMIRKVMSKMPPNLSVPGGQCLRVEDKGGGLPIELYSSSGASVRFSLVEARGGRWFLAAQPDGNLVLYDQNNKPKGIWRP